LDPHVRNTLRDFLLGKVSSRKAGLLRYLILALIAVRPMSGYDIMKAVSSITRGAWKPSPGTIYPLLRRLSEEGSVRWREERIRGKLRKIYVPTESGLGEVREVISDPEVRSTILSIPLNEPQGREMMVKLLEELETILEFIEENIDEVRSSGPEFNARLKAVLSRIMRALEE